MQPVTITENQEREYFLYKENKLNERTLKRMSYLFSQIDKRGYETEERIYNVGMKVLFQHNGETLEGNIFTMKENNSSGGFGIYIRVGPHIIEFKQKEVVRLYDER